MVIGDETQVHERLAERVVVTREEKLLQESILATLVYHDLLGMALTAVEAWRFLLRPKVGEGGMGHPTHANLRFSWEPGRNGAWATGATLRDVETVLGGLVSREILNTQNGFYCLPGRVQCVTERVERHALAQRKWSRLRQIVWWLQGVPFLRMVAGSGSLAREFVREESDLDVLIVAAPGRIWTVRFLVTVLLDVLGMRRRPTGPTQDLVCLNHYLALDGLRLPYHSIYTAYEYARLVPLLGEDVCDVFREHNRGWMEQFLTRVLPDVASHQKRVRSSGALRAVARAGEWLLGGHLGRSLESLLGVIQERRIARTGEGSEIPGRVVTSPRALEFHPHSREAPMIVAFNERVASLGLEAFGGQRDSGLSREPEASVAPSVSVIIPVRSVTPELRECIGHLRTVQPSPLEVLVVTDAPVKEEFGGPVRFLTHAGPPAAKRDVAARAARGDILAFLDDDAYPEANWLACALRHFADQGVAGVGGPAVTPPHDGRWAQASGAVLTSALGSGPTRMRHWPIGPVRPIDDWPTVNLLIRREVFAAVGGFGTQFWPGEDTKLCLEVIRRGYRILYDPTALCFHHRATTPLRHLRQVARYGLHRGHFARILPETSRRFSYALPVLAVVGLLGGVLVVLFAPALRLPLGLLALTATVVTVVAGIREALRVRRPVVGVLYPPLLVATHLAYGLAFLRGLLAPSLKRYQRASR